MEAKCRLCLSKEKLIWVFDPRIINTNKLSDIIHNATGVQISEADPVTQMVCHECCLYTVDIYKFRVKCLINNNVLHSFDDQKVKLEPLAVKEEAESLPRTPSKRTRSQTRDPATEHNYANVLGRPDGDADGARCAKEKEGDGDCNKSNRNGTIKDEYNESGNSPAEKFHDESYGQDTTDDVYKSEETPSIIPNPHRLMITRAKRRLKSDIERRKLDKQKIIESLYAENIDKIMFTSYLKLAPKYEVVVPESSIYKEGGMNCKLCKAGVSLGSTLREHLERECEVFKMIDNLPTVNVIRMEQVVSLKDAYPSVLRQVRSVKKVKKFKCSCCDDSGV